jgi:hypothetical protein
MLQTLLGTGAIGSVCPSSAGVRSSQSLDWLVSEVVGGFSAGVRSSQSLLDWSVSEVVEGGRVCFRLFFFFLDSPGWLVAMSVSVSTATIGRWSLLKNELANLQDVNLGCGASDSVKKVLDACMWSTRIAFPA